MTAQTKEAIKAFQLDISHDATGLLTAEQRTILFNDAANIATADEEVPMRSPAPSSRPASKRNNRQRLARSLTRLTPQRPLLSEAAAFRC